MGSIHWNLFKYNYRYFSPGQMQILPNAIYLNTNTNAFHLIYSFMWNKIYINVCLVVNRHIRSMHWKCNLNFKYIMKVFKYKCKYLSFQKAQIQMLEKSIWKLLKIQVVLYLSPCQESTSIVMYTHVKCWVWKPGV